MKAAQLFDVSGLVTIVTGGASGIGLGYCEVMADNGARVFAFDRDAAALKTPPKGITGIVADVTHKAGLEKAFDDVAAQAGRIDVVFVNAGIGGGPGWLRAGEDTRNEERAFEDLPAEQWAQVMATNVTGAFTTIQAAARHMKPNAAGASSSRRPARPTRLSNMSEHLMSSRKPPSHIWCAKARMSWRLTVLR